MNNEIKIEICCGSLSDVMTACRFPIDRIELVNAAELGGLTPSPASFRLAEKISSKPLIVLIRPRCAGFVYSQAEQDTMFMDAEYYLKEGADGIAFGFLNPDHTIDQENTCRMIELIHSYGKTAVFHMAADQAKDYKDAVRTLAEVHCDRVLTGGHNVNALPAADDLKDVCSSYGSSIEILAAADISCDNVRTFLDQTGVRQIQLRAMTTFVDQGTYEGLNAVQLNALLAQLGKRQIRTQAEKDSIPQPDIEMMLNDRYETQMEGR